MGPSGQLFLVWSYTEYIEVFFTPRRCAPSPVCTFWPKSRWASSDLMSSESFNVPRHSCFCCGKEVIVKSPRSQGGSVSVQICCEKKTLWCLSRVNVFMVPDGIINQEIPSGFELDWPGDWKRRFWSGPSDLFSCKTNGFARPLEFLQMSLKCCCFSTLYLVHAWQTWIHRDIFSDWNFGLKPQRPQMTRTTRVYLLNTGSRTGEKAASRNYFFWLTSRSNGSVIESCLWWCFIQIKAKTGWLWKSRSRSAGCALLVPGGWLVIPTLPPILSFARWMPS